MFDYQAGEKYKLTLIIVGFAGAMVGMFFTLLLSPEPHTQRVASHRPKWADDPDVNGGKPGYRRPAEEPGTQGAPPQAEEPYVATSTDAAIGLIEQWLPKAWDFSAQTAGTSQEQAIQYMTADCAQAYRTNIWTPELAQQIAASGARSSFQRSRCQIGETRPDGAVVVLVEGQQVLEIPGKGQNAHEVKLEYLVKQNNEGKIQIAGISEGGGKSLGI